MSNLSISDGEPITYDFLQQLVKVVNDLDSKINGNRRANSQKISVVGSGLTNLQTITVVCDSQIINIGEKQTYKDNIKFPAATFGQVPHIVASIADLDASGQDILNAPYATVSIGKVSKGQFECRVDVLKASAKNTQIKVNYIAIGKGSTT